MAQTGSLDGCGLFNVLAVPGGGVVLSDAEASLAYVQVVKVAGVSLWALFREKKVTLPKFIA